MQADLLDSEGARAVWLAAHPDALRLLCGCYWSDASGDLGAKPGCSDFERYSEIIRISLTGKDLPGVIPSGGSGSPL